MAKGILKHQAVLKEQLEKSLTNFKKTPKSRLTKTYIETKLTLLENLWNTFVSNHEAVIKEEDVDDSEYIMKDQYFIVEEHYTITKCEMLDTLEKLTPATTASVVNSNLSSKPVQSDIKLPRINLPTFTGRYTEWISYHDLFVSLIHSNKSLQNVQKLHYLKSSLSGEAESLLRHKPVTEASYEDAWSTLKKRYNNKRIIVNSILRKLMTQRSVTNESSSSIKYILDTTNECLSALKNLGIDSSTWDPILIYMIVSKLNSESIRLWEQSINTPDCDQELPTYKQLGSFLETRFRTLEALDSQSKPQVRPRTNQNSFHVALGGTACKFCKSDHMIQNCKDFILLHYDEKKLFIEKNGLCFNCLIPGHVVYKCKQRTSCRICGKKHHSLIHPENKAQTVEKTDTRDTQREVTNDKTPVHNVRTHYADKELNNDVLLATAIVKVQGQNGATHYLRALIDPGSQGSFITEAAAQFLGYKKIPINCKINGLGNNESSLTSKYMVIFNLHSRYDLQFETPVRAYVLKSLTRVLPEREITRRDWPHLHQLQLADPNYNNPNKIDILIGAEVYGEIITDGLKKGPQGTPVAQKTHLGWIISGQLHNNTTLKRSYSITTSLHTCIEGDDILKRFWEIESDVSHKKILTEEESRCEQHFKETHRRNEDGRYSVSLPFKDNDPSCQYGSSKQIAERRLLQIERKLEKDKELKKEYEKVMNDYLKQDHMEEIVDEAEKLKCTAVYLPHHAVVRKDKTTTKVRIVYDASCRYKNNVSLNENLMIGPRLQQDLRHIIMRWRQHKICMVADIVQMYRQIKINEPDYQRILWRENRQADMKDYRITRVTFGTASAPYLATKVLQQLALDESGRFLVASEITLKDFYMDDLLTGGDTYEDAMLIYNQMTKLLRCGKFELQKWNTNDPDLLRYMHKSSHEDSEKELNLDMTIKTLGIVWNNKKDEFRYSVNLPETTTSVTKRSVASDVSRLFDPMGWLAPTILIGKVFLQKLWLTGINWDQEVTKDLKNDWIRYRSELPTLAEIIVPRWMHTWKKDKRLELYGFADASTVAYGGVVYSRIVDDDDIVHISLITAKTRVAPVKTVSVPRLELCGAALLTNLLDEVAEHLKVAKENIYAYTDSKVVLAWLQSHPSKWKTFIANRTSEIINKLPARHWNYVKSSENPADVASRGIYPSALKDTTLWWKGPTWLYNKGIPHETTTDLTDVLPLEEKRVNFVNTNIEVNFTDIFERYSTLEKMIRVIATCKRLNVKRKENLPTYLTSDELESALTVCIQLCQQETFKEDIARLKENKLLKTTSKIRSLNPFIDEKSMLRVGGRLRNAQLPEDTKHQILLPDHNHLSKLIVRQAHKKTIHGGPMLMLNYIRQRFWILGAKNMIKKEVHGCVVCVRHRAATRKQLMADLPSQRVTPTRPFFSSCVDFAGPIDLRMSKGRGNKTYKGYLCIFVCMSTRAMHIEIVSGLDCNSFVAAFKRFTARRGHCSNIWSDNGSNFIAGNKQLKAMLKEHTESVEKEIQEQLARDGTTWHNIPPGAPHFGGLWEAGVRSVKHHLKRTLGNTTLTYEEMCTITAQIEACLNSRPMSAISDNVDDLLPLTPGHFLIGEPTFIIPEKSYLDSSITKLNRWQLTQKLVQHFWQRWSQEYLSRLQQRPKWVKRVTDDIKINMLVLVKDENLPPEKWSLARIIDMHPGSDGLTRVVTLKCKNSVFKRPITKICVLPVVD